MLVLGVDACSTGWVGILLADGRYAGDVVSPSLEALCDAVPDAVVVGVDMPIGLREDGWRTADAAAARLLGPRRSSVFRVPPRAVWDAPDYPAANAACRALTGAGMSRQAYGLREKLVQANGSWAAADGRLREVHPELSFAALAGAPMPYRKTTWTGQALRRDTLAAAGLVLPAVLQNASAVRPDDVLDAAAVAWSATRIAAGTAVSVPDPPESGIAIWF